MRSALNDPLSARRAVAIDARPVPNVTLSLISHTNVGKTTLARTLLRQDVGEVRDAPHVTAENAVFIMLESEGDVLRLWDTQCVVVKG
jgi:predicted GTPase